MVVPNGIRRLALAAAGVPLAAALTTVMLTSPSLAATQSSVTPAGGPALAAQVHRTTISNLHVRKKPSTSATVVAVLKKAGTKVTVNCWTRGTSVFGDNVWYHITKPHVGFVAGFYLNTGADPAAGIPNCNNRVFATIIANLHVRTKPHVKATVVAVLKKAGTLVRISCWTRGSSVFGDNVWYHITKPHVGFVAGFYINTGPDPRPGIPHC
ncbi:MAG TPA: SH3 domain-containing protein [Streptosporangiaceae bacterium]|nr:SH3 domain-containing protein [Streptosporangiaceae bacterium]